MPRDIATVRTEIAQNAERAPCMSKWRHLKSGGEYHVVAHVVIEATLEPAVVYRHPYDPADLWCRPASEFFDGRFRALGSD